MGDRWDVVDSVSHDVEMGFMGKSLFKSFGKQRAKLGVIGSLVAGPLAIALFVVMQIQLSFFPDEPKQVVAKIVGESVTYGASGLDSMSFFVRYKLEQDGVSREVETKLKVQKDKVAEIKSRVPLLIEYDPKKPKHVFLPEQRRKKNPWIVLLVGSALTAGGVWGLSRWRSGKYD